MEEEKVRKIVWKQHEADIVIWKAFQLLDAGHVRTVANGVLEAQELLLPPSRWRPKSSVVSSTPLYRKRYAELIPLMKQQEETKLLKTAQQDESQAVIEPEPSTLVVSSEESAVIPSKSEMIDTVVTDAVTRIAELFKSLLLTELKSVVADVLSDVVLNVEKQSNTFETIPRLRVVLPKVVVAGFRPGQQGELARTFSGKLNMTFIEERVSPIRLKNAAATADFIVLNTAYCGHNYLEVVRDHPGLIRVESFNTLRDKLSEIIKRQ